MVGDFFQKTWEYANLQKNKSVTFLARKYPHFVTNVSLNPWFQNMFFGEMTQDVQNIIDLNNTNDLTSEETKLEHKNTFSSLVEMTLGAILQDFTDNQITKMFYSLDQNKREEILSRYGLKEDFFTNADNVFTLGVTDTLISLGRDIFLEYFKVKIPTINASTVMNSINSLNSQDQNTFFNFSGNFLENALKQLSKNDSVTPQILTNSLLNVLEASLHQKNSKEAFNVIVKIATGCIDNPVVPITPPKSRDRIKDIKIDKTKENFLISTFKLCVKVIVDFMQFLKSAAVEMILKFSKKHKKLFDKFLGTNLFNKLLDTKMVKSKIDPFSQAFGIDYGCLTKFIKNSPKETKIMIKDAILYNSNTIKAIKSSLDNFKLNDNVLSNVISTIGQKSTQNKIVFIKGLHAIMSSYTKYARISKTNLNEDTKKKMTVGLVFDTLNQLFDRSKDGEEKQFFQIVSDVLFEAPKELIQQKATEPQKNETYYISIASSAFMKVTQNVVEAVSDLLRIKTPQKTVQPQTQLGM